VSSQGDSSKIGSNKAISNPPEEVTRSTSPPPRPLSPTFLSSSRSLQIPSCDSSTSLATALRSVLDTHFQSAEVRPNDILLKFMRKTKQFLTYLNGIPTIYEGFMTKRGEDNLLWKVRCHSIVSFFTSLTLTHRRCGISF
jgi:hypothetical protein